jgi:hypothetical protein
MLMWPNKNVFKFTFRGLLEDDRKIDLIIFWATPKELFFRELLEMLLEDNMMFSQNVYFSCTNGT